MDSWQLPASLDDYARGIANARITRLYETVERLMPFMPQAQELLAPFDRALRAGDETVWDPAACTGGGFTIYADDNTAELVDVLLQLAGWSTLVDSIGYTDGRSVTVRRPPSVMP